MANLNRLGQLYLMARTLLLTILFINFLSSCSSTKDKIDDKGAISVFADLHSIKIDKDLVDTKITIPEPQNNILWLGGSPNQHIENILFANKITKYNTIWSGYRTQNKDRKVFAPVINDNIIYLLDDRGNLYAKNIKTYKNIWQKKIIHRKQIKNFTTGKISFSDGKIFAITGYNRIIAINAKNGKILWQKSIASIPISSVIGDKWQVFVITNDNKTYAFNSKTGQINWIHSGILRPTGIMGAANPVFYKNYIISSYSSGEIYALNKKDGEAGWSHDLNLNRIDSSDFLLNDIDATPVIKDEVVYCISNGGLMAAIKIIDGKILWKKEISSIANFWIANNFIYLVNNKNQLMSLHKDTGGVKWFVNLNKYKKDNKPEIKITYKSIIMAGGNLIINSSDGKLLLTSPFDGKILQTNKISGNFHNPIIVNNKLYLHKIRMLATSLTILE